MTTHAPRNPDCEAVIRDSFTKQGVMGLMGGQLLRVAPGEIDVEVPYRRELTQQRGLLHAGVTTTALDSACGYAALSLSPPGSDVVSVNFNVSLLAPAVGERLVARARVVRSGRTITFTEADAFMVGPDGTETHVASMTASMMRIDVS